MVGTISLELLDSFSPNVVLVALHPTFNGIGQAIFFSSLNLILVSSHITCALLVATTTVVILIRSDVSWIYDRRERDRDCRPCYVGMTEADET